MTVAGRMQVEASWVVALFSICAAAPLAERSACCQLAVARDSVMLATVHCLSLICECICPPQHAKLLANVLCLQGWVEPGVDVEPLPVTWRCMFCQHLGLE